MKGCRPTRTSRTTSGSTSTSTATTATAWAPRTRPAGPVSSPISSTSSIRPIVEDVRARGTRYLGTVGRRENGAWHCREGEDGDGSDYSRIQSGPAQLQSLSQTPGRAEGAGDG